MSVIETEMWADAWDDQMVSHELKAFSEANSIEGETVVYDREKHAGSAAPTPAWHLQPIGKEFARLVAACRPPATAKAEIDQLLEMKLAGSELDGGERNPVLDSYVEELRAQIESSLLAPEPLPPLAVFDAARRETRRLALT